MSLSVPLSGVPDPLVALYHDPRFDAVNVTRDIVSVTEPRAGPAADTMALELPHPMPSMSEQQGGPHHETGSFDDLVRGYSCVAMPGEGTTYVCPLAATDTDGKLDVSVLLETIERVARSLLGPSPTVQDIGDAVSRGLEAATAGLEWTSRHHVYVLRWMEAHGLLPDSRVTDRARKEATTAQITEALVTDALRAVLSEQIRADSGVVGYDTAGTEGPAVSSPDAGVWDRYAMSVIREAAVHVEDAIDDGESLQTALADAVEAFRSQIWVSPVVAAVFLDVARAPFLVDGRDCLESEQVADMARGGWDRLVSSGLVWHTVRDAILESTGYEWHHRPVGEPIER
jgi:hypothetical protein